MRIGHGHAERTLSTEEVRGDRRAGGRGPRPALAAHPRPGAGRHADDAAGAPRRPPRGDARALAPTPSTTSWRSGRTGRMNDEQLTRLLGRPREERPGRPEPGLQPRLRPRIADARRDDLRRRGGGDHRGAPDRGGPRPREPSRLRLRRRPRLRAGLPARGRRLLGREQVLLPRHRRPGGHQPDALARGAPLELRGHRLGLHAGARRSSTARRPSSTGRRPASRPSSRTRVWPGSSSATRTRRGSRRPSSRRASTSRGSTRPTGRSSR